MSVDARHHAILAAFARHDVAFVLIGGVGCQAYGWTRATIDVDVTIAIDDANVARANAARGELGARHPAVGPHGTSFATALGRLELMRETDAVGGFSQWRARAQLIDLGDSVKVLVGHPDDLLASKEHANRDKDREQLPGIRRDFITAGVLDASLARGSVEMAPQPRHLVTLLGARPPSGVAGRVWDSTADAVRDYRARYAIDDAEHALGSTPPAGSSQAAQRDELQRAITRARTIIRRHAPGSDAAHPTATNVPTEPTATPPSTPPPAAPKHPGSRTADRDRGR